MGFSTSAFRFQYQWVVLQGNGIFWNGCVILLPSPILLLFSPTSLYKNQITFLIKHYHSKSLLLLYFLNIQIEQVQASKIGRNGESTTAMTIGWDWNWILIVGYKKANGNYCVWFSFYGFSSLSVPKLDFVACCVMLCWRLHACMLKGNSSWSPLSWMLLCSNKSLSRFQYTRGSRL